MQLTLTKSTILESPRCQAQTGFGTQVASELLNPESYYGLHFKKPRVRCQSFRKVTSAPSLTGFYFVMCSLPLTPPELLPLPLPGPEQTAQLPPRDHISVFSALSFLFFHLAFIGCSGEWGHGGHRNGWHDPKIWPLTGGQITRVWKLHDSTKPGCDR